MRLHYVPTEIHMSLCVPVPPLCQPIVNVLGDVCVAYICDAGESFIVTVTTYDEMVAYDIGIVTVTVPVPPLPVAVPY